MPTYRISHVYEYVNLFGCASRRFSRRARGPFTTTAAGRFSRRSPDMTRRQRPSVRAAPSTRKARNREPRRENRDARQRKLAARRNIFHTPHDVPVVQRCAALRRTTPEATSSKRVYTPGNTIARTSHACVRAGNALGTPHGFRGETIRLRALLTRELRRGGTFRVVFPTRLPRVEPM